ncbi:MAG: 50S ribosomal protein L28 [Planctomycetes bacterium]|nr:50S ribosomal protein L28 [Planctomycetota bacterium]MCC7397203.1 50S ribosomal protein L28 [Planctomycetota bacterium]
MSRVCDVTGRRTRIGHQVKRRGLAKKDGGVGRRVTGRSKRTFKPNLQPVRVMTPEGAIVTLKLSTKVIKRGIISLKKGDKVVSFPLVKAVRGRNSAFSVAQKGGAQKGGAQKSGGGKAAAAKVGAKAATTTTKKG